MSQVNSKNGEEVMTSPPAPVGEGIQQQEGIKVDEMPYNLTWRHFEECMAKLQEEAEKEGGTDYSSDSTNNVILYTEEGEGIEAYKNVLSVCSPMFKGIFETKNEAGVNEVGALTIRGVSLRDLQHVVQFIYQGQLTLDSDPELNSFLATASKLQILGCSTEPVNAAADQFQVNLDYFGDAVPAPEEETAASNNEVGTSSAVTPKPGKKSADTPASGSKDKRRKVAVVPPAPPARPTTATPKATPKVKTLKKSCFICRQKCLVTVKCQRCEQIMCEKGTCLGTRVRCLDGSKKYFCKICG